MMSVYGKSKLMQIAATMVCVTHAQWSGDALDSLGSDNSSEEVGDPWSDLQSFTEVVEVTDNRQNGTGKNNCF